MFANPYTSKRVFTRRFCCLSELIVQLINCFLVHVRRSTPRTIMTSLMHARYSIRIRGNDLKNRRLRLILIGDVVDKLLRFELESLSPPINIPRNQFVDCARVESIIYRFANEKVYFSNTVTNNKIHHLCIS